MRLNHGYMCVIPLATEHSKVFNELKAETVYAEGTTTTRLSEPLSDCNDRQN